MTTQPIHRLKIRCGYVYLMQIRLVHMLMAKNSEANSLFRPVLRKKEFIVLPCGYGRQ